MWPQRSRQRWIQGSLDSNESTSLWKFCLRAFCPILGDDRPVWHETNGEMHILRKRENVIRDFVCKFFFRSPTFPLFQQEFVDRAAKSDKLQNLPWFFQAIKHKFYSPQKSRQSLLTNFHNTFTCWTKSSSFSFSEWGTFGTFSYEFLPQKFA